LGGAVKYGVVYPLGSALDEKKKKRKEKEKHEEASREKQLTL